MGFKVCCSTDQSTRNLTASRVEYAGDAVPLRIVGVTTPAVVIVKYIAAPLPTPTGVSPVSGRYPAGNVNATVP